MNPMEFAYKHFHRLLAPRSHEWGTAPKGVIKAWPETTVEAMHDRLKRVADTAKRIEGAKTIIEEAIKNNPLKNGLPF